MKTNTKIPQPVLDAAARAKIDKALAHIQEAQNHLGSACGELSALCGAIPQWKRASALYDQVHAYWYKVDGLRHNPRIYLDSTNVDALEKRLTTLTGGRELASVTVQELYGAHASNYGTVDGAPEGQEVEGCGGDAVLDRSVP